MSGPLTVTMRALRIANTPRAGITPSCVVGLPICWANAEPAQRSNSIKSLIRISIIGCITAARTRCRRRRDRVGGDVARAVTDLVPAVYSAPPVRASHVPQQARDDAQVLLAIEEDLTVDERCIHARIDAERMSIPDCEVSVFADFN